MSTARALAATVAVLALPAAHAHAQTTPPHETHGGAGTPNGGTPGASALTATAPMIEMKNKRFNPGAVEVLVGEPVTFHNSDSIDHDVAADDGSFDSGRIHGGTEWQATPTVQGFVPYHCTLHRFMNGRMLVLGLLVDVPAQQARPGAPVTITGRAPAGAGPVMLETADGAGGWTPVAEAVTADGGRFSASHAPSSPVRIRARAGELLSRELNLEPSPQLHVTARRQGSRLVVAVHTSPAQPGATVQLERYDRERFTFQPWRTAKLRSDSSATFRVPTRSSARVRAVLVKGVGGYGRATSRAVQVRAVAGAAGHRHH